MLERQPYWVRHKAILRGAQLAGVGKMGRAILRELLAGEDGRTQTVIRSRAQIAAGVGCSERTLERHMPQLVALGIVRKAYSKGGAHRANIYQLNDISGAYPQVGAENNPEAVNLRQSVGGLDPKTSDNLSGVCNIKPPTECRKTSDRMSDPSESLREKERGREPSRPARRWDKAPAGGVGVEKAAELALLSAALRVAGDYGGAQRLIASGWRPADRSAVP